MRKDIMSGLLLVGIMCAAPPPAMANIDPPWGFPECGNNIKPGDLKRGILPKPYVWNRQVYSGIYLGIEEWITPQAASLYPDLAFDEHRNWVVISRSDRRGKKEGEAYTIKGAPQTAHYPWRRISMRIDKCDGTVSQMRVY